jgi:hypothetical protein
VGAKASIDGVITLVDRGVARAVIIIPGNPSKGEVIAANELKKYFRKSTGGLVEILSDNFNDNVSDVENAYTASEIQFHIGKTQQILEYIKSEHIKLETNEEFIIRSFGNKIFLLGGSDLGTRFAAYYFLEHYLGIKWFMPTELFEYVPKHRTFSVDFPINVYQKPAFEPRVYYCVDLGENYGYAGERDSQYGCDIWATRNYLTVDGNGKWYDFSHNLKKIIVPSKYGKEHPEYFPFLNGKRRVPTNDHDEHWQPCLSNPNVVSISIQEARNYFDRNPAKDTFSLGMNDSDIWCECSECKAMDTHPRFFRGFEVMSERYFAFVNSVAREVAKTHPGKWIGTIAYINTERPPEGIILEPNVKVYITQDSSQYYDEDFRQEDYKTINEWLDVCKAVCKYDYYSLGWILPKYHPGLIQSDLKNSKELGLKSYYIEDVPSWGQSGPLYYIGTRLMWDPEADYLQLEKEFCEKLFAEAAEPMQKYFSILRKGWLKSRKGIWFEGYNNVIDQIAVYNIEEANQCGNLLAEAKGMVRDQITMERLKIFEDAGLLFKMYMQEQEMIDRIQKAEIKTDEDLQRLISWVVMLGTLKEQREQHISEIKDQSGLLGRRLNVQLDLGKTPRWDPLVDTIISKATSLIVKYLTENTLGSEIALSSLINDYPSTKLAETAKDLLAIQNNSLGNLIKNPSFERHVDPVNKVQDDSQIPSDWVVSNKLPIGWSTWFAAIDSSTQEPKFIWDDNVAKTGESSLRIKGASVSSCYIYRYPIKQNFKYWVSCSVRTNAKDRDRIRLAVRWQDSKGAWTQDKFDISVPITVTDASDEWVDLINAFIPPPNAAFAVFLLSASGLKEDESVWFDDLAFYELYDTSK